MLSRFGDGFAAQAGAEKVQGGLELHIVRLDSLDSLSLEAKYQSTKRASEWLQPGVVTDRTDPKLAHIDGLNLSRAWMLEGIAHGLKRTDKRVPALLAAAL